MKITVRRDPLESGAPGSIAGDRKNCAPGRVFVPTRCFRRATVPLREDRRRSRTSPISKTGN